MGGAEGGAAYCAAIAARGGASPRHQQNLWDGNGVEYGLDDIVCGFTLSLGLVRQRDAVAQNVGRDGFDVVRAEIGAAVENGVCLGCANEIDGCTGGCGCH